MSQADTERAIEAISGIADVISKINERQTTIATAVEEQSATQLQTLVGRFRY